MDKTVYLLDIRESVGQREAMIRQSDDLVEQSEALIGQRQDLPGQSETLIGQKKDLPGQKEDLPGHHKKLDCSLASVEAYLKKGMESGVHKKYLVSIRKPWYSMEQRAVAPIWVSTACRNGLKFIRNLAGVKSLTTFHSIYINHPYEDYVNILFCYFLTPIAQKIIRENRKELGNGLDKFQPNDLKTARMLDLTLLSPEDCESIEAIYSHLCENYQDPVIKEKLISELNQIFEAYLR